MLRKILLSVAVVAALVAFSGRAEAGLTLRLDQIGGTPPAALVVLDGGAGDLLPGVSGSLLFAGTFGDFILTIQAATSNAGSASDPAILSISSTVTLSPTAVGSVFLSVAVSDDTFTVPTGPDLVLTSFATNVSSPSFAFTTGVGTGSFGVVNTFAPVYGAAGHPTLINPPEGNTSITTISVPAGVFTIANAGLIQGIRGVPVQTQGQSTLSSVPEPTTMVVWAGMMGGVSLVSAIRRRKNKQVAA